MIVLLDTTVLIDVLRDRNDRRSLLAGIVEHGHTLATSAINVGEVYAGMRPHEAAGTQSLLDQLHCFPITSDLARTAGALVHANARKGKTLTLADMLVAATAIAHGCALMTDNRKDFPLPDLSFVPVV